MRLRHHDRIKAEGAAPSPEAGKGIRLFAGDGFLLERKFGAKPDALRVAVAANDIVFTVTGASAVEAGGESFVRLHFSCPAGVFLRTHRQLDEGEPVAVYSISTHRVLTVSRRQGESIRLRPVSGREEEAVRALEAAPPIVEAWESPAGPKGEVKLKVSAPDCWEILRSELAAVAAPPESEQYARFLAAFHAAAERLLSDRELGDIRRAALDLMKR
jgi:hypothetical protein